MKVGDSIRRRRGSSGTGRGRTPAGGSAATLLGLALLMILLGGSTGYLFATRVLFPLPEEIEELVEVPGLRGLAVEDVEARLAEVGLLLASVDSLRHPTVDAGRVLGQSPLGGQMALPGSEVRVTVSQGGERSAVPGVLGLRVDRAVTLLEATGFRVEADSVESPQSAGSVVRQNPGAGTRLPLTETVRIQVSLGLPAVELPNFRGMTEEEAVQMIEALGLVVAEVRSSFRFGRDRGIVVDQTPDAGIRMERGTAVTLVVGQR